MSLLEAMKYLKVFIEVLRFFLIIWCGFRASRYADEGNTAQVVFWTFLTYLNCESFL